MTTGITATEVRRIARALDGLRLAMVDNTKAIKAQTATIARVVQLREAAIRERETEGDPQETSTAL